jgi:putative intracellular protease/amidase
MVLAIPWYWRYHRPIAHLLSFCFDNSRRPDSIEILATGNIKEKKGKHVTGFTDGEEEEMQLTKVVPFLVEDELMRLGATFEKLADWQPLSVVDGRLITGQNPASSTVAAQNLVNLLAAEKAA